MAVSKLNQIIAVEKGVKSGIESAITKAYHTLQKPDLFNGLTKTYTPAEEGGETFPGESQKIVATMAGVLESFESEMIRLFDITATKVYANCVAKADVVVKDATILRQVPVEYLLFLEKRLGDFLLLLGKVPVLDPTLDWTWDETRSCFRTEPVITHRSKKVPRNHVKAEATDKHPAQVEVYFEDTTVGTWSLTRYSAALSETRRRELREKVTTLLAAVKSAREEANNTEAPNVEGVGEAIFGYVFG